MLFVLMDLVFRPDGFKINYLSRELGSISTTFSLILKWKAIIRVSTQSLEEQSRETTIEIIILFENDIRRRMILLHCSYYFLLRAKKAVELLINAHCIQCMKKSIENVSKTQSLKLKIVLCSKHGVEMHEYAPNLPLSLEIIIEYDSFENESLVLQN